MTNNLTCQRSVTAALLGLALLAASPARAQHHGLSVDASLEQSVFLADEDLPVKVRVINRSGQTLALAPGRIG